MKRPDFISNEDIDRWNQNINNDSCMPNFMKQSVTLREVCYAGFWLSEQLYKLDCPIEKIIQLQFTGGKMAFGHDVWQVHQELLEAYKNDKIYWEEDESSQIN